MSSPSGHLLVSPRTHSLRARWGHLGGSSQALGRQILQEPPLRILLQESPQQRLTLSQNIHPMHAPHVQHLLAGGLMTSHLGKDAGSGADSWEPTPLTGT